MEQIGVRRGYYPYFDGRREDALVMRGRLPLAPPSAARRDALAPLRDAADPNEPAPC
jgi:hypothetical protein